ncbi:MAG: hypothetical protein Salg2KO_22910 [Salibacteraceae bacterium]
MAVSIISDDQFKELVSTVKKVDERLDQLSSIINKQSGELLDNEDLCRIFKCTTRTLQNWRDRGYLKFIKPEGSNIIMYRRKDVDEFIVSNNKTQGTND